MDHTQSLEPIVGEWYRSHGQLFEVVATDEDDAVIEVQHADGNLEEIDLEDWMIRVRAGSLAAADPPEDSGRSTDHEDDHEPGLMQSTMDEMHGLRASAIEDLDLFD